MNDIRKILEDLGYRVFSDGRHLRMRPLYRESNNDTSLSVCNQTGYFSDFSAGIQGTLGDLVQMTLKLSSKKEAEEWLKNRSYVSAPKQKPTIKGIKIFPASFLESIKPVHDYWIKRGISEETIKIFEGGVVTEKGRMRGRYVFPIFDRKRNLIGMSGRDLTPNDFRPRWKTIGQKANFAYPLFINHDIIKDKRSVIVLESIGDAVSLFEIGVKNVFVLFGVMISVEQLNVILKLDPDKIYICLNNDVGNNDVGNIAAKKLKDKLIKYFDEAQVQTITLPEKDVNFMLTQNKQNLIDFCKQSSLLKI